jgi:formylglycine-generating enzyme
MKKTKPAPRPTPPPAGAGSRRPTTRQKLGRIGIVVACLALGTLFAAALLYPDVFWPAPNKLALAAEPEDNSPLKLNPTAPPGPAPDGMVWIPGGDFHMGGPEPDEAFHPPIGEDCYPVHRVYVDGFWMDTTEVTNEQFAKFVSATGYRTVAELPLDIKDFTPEERQQIKPEQLRPFSTVFKKADPEVPINLRHPEAWRAWWDVVYGACWKHPEGPGSDIKGREKYPVVHVCYDDALAYCKWAGKRLPTEAEWEFAARGGLDRKHYPWGDELKRDGKWMTNAWQGRFPYENTKADGFEGVAPVGSFPPNGFGLYDVSGNVWEWCADWYQPDYYAEKGNRTNPQGPTSGYDPREPGIPKRVQRGGSFLCSDLYCARYILGSRHAGEPRSPSMHVGFRCAK